MLRLSQASACLMCLMFCALGMSTQLTYASNPVAVRWWGRGMVSIETYWNLQVVIDPYGPELGDNEPELSADLVLVTHEDADRSHVSSMQGNPKVVWGLSPQGEVEEINGYLDRLPNGSEIRWLANTETNSAKPSPHAVHVRTIPAWHDDARGANRGVVAMFMVTVDGVRILHAGDLGQTELFEEQLKWLEEADVLLVPIGGVDTIDGPQAAKLVQRLKPRYVIPMHFKTDQSRTDLNPVKPFITAIGSTYDVDRSTGNTLAVSAADSDDERSTRVVILNDTPWHPEGELQALIQRMETACSESQRVFSELSAEQLNWRPPNGSHTPRWNAEHMMGRQLGFFSQIYAAIDPEITPLNLNPQQMPPDYEAAHPDWGGPEEARQMERAAAFVRRYAYLLDQVDLDKRAPGSRWTLRRLLLQMERHFNQHTANVKKKFDLPGWPGN